ncbi:CXADR-like membrane protein [Rhinophrynus dorsalis]
MDIRLQSFLGLCYVLGTLAQTDITLIAEDNVTLPCWHSLGLLGKESLDIEWLSNISEHGQQVLLSYSGQKIYENPNQKGRYSFVSNYLAGDASMLIRSLETSDAGLYICKVKNAGQYEWNYIKVKVLAKPSEPQCRTEGEMLEGKNVTLHCKSSTGTKPMIYRWLRVNLKDNVVRPVQSNAQIGKENQLLLHNLSKTDNGSYRCEVSNEAGRRICDVHLNVQKASNVGFLAGVICGVVVGVFLIFLTLWLLFRKKELKKREEDEFLNEIREDAEAPKARLMKPGSSSSDSRSSRSGSSSTRSTTNSASRSQRTLSTQETPHAEQRHHCLEQI